MLRSVVCVAVLCASLFSWKEAAAQAYNPANDIVLVWNQVMLDANAQDSRQLIQDQGGPTRCSRAFAIVSAAVYDSYNSIHHRRTPYLTELFGYANADHRAAVSKAACDTLKALYPQQVARFNTAYTNAMASVPAGVPRTKGIELGTKVAKAILDARRNDNSSLSIPYTPDILPGYHQPDPLHPNQGYHAPHWGFVDTFVIGDITQWPSPPPPALNSPAYAAALNEVKLLGGDGRTTRTIRTPAQTITGIFWAYDGTPGLGAPPRLYNQVVRAIAISRRNTVEANATLFLLVNLSMADAGIQCWYTKYYYEFWRPVIGIRNADLDGNPDTTVDRNWRPLGAPATNRAGDGVNFTPPFPAYSSGHASFGSAALYATAAYYGTMRLPFSFTSDEFNGINVNGDGTRRPVVTRRYTYIDEPIFENAYSRIYLGIHWSFDSDDGIASGLEIANYVTSRVALVRLSPPKG